MRSGLFCMILAAPAAIAAQEPAVSPLAANYGFLPVEVNKLSERSGNLLSGDFNDDGRIDLVLVDNGHHRIDLLIQRAARPDAALRAPEARDVNRLDDHWRFEHRKIPVDQDIVSLALGDFNHDGRTDLAYFGAPDQLVIRLQSDDAAWTARQQLRLPDVASAQWCLAAGDLNGDDRTDLVVLGKSDTLILLQPEKGEFGPPLKLLNTSDELGLVQVADLNDDGREDLCYLAGDSVNRSLGIRLQSGDGQLGPEYLFDLERPRAVSVRDVDGGSGDEVVTIDSRTGRVKILKLTTRENGVGALPDRLVRYGFGKRGSGRSRDWAIGDFDGDGLDDVAVSDPDASRVLLFRQSPKRGLDLGTPHASVSGADLVRAAAVRPGQPVSLFVHSDAEKSIGVSTWESGRLTFPQALPLDVEPAGMELVNITGDERPEVVFLTRDKEVRNSSYSLAVFRRTADDAGWEADPEYAEKPIGPLSLKSAPERSLLANLTGDGRPELIFFQGSKPPVVIGAGADGRWQEITTSGSLGAGTIPGGAVFPGRINDDVGLLVAQDNFVRLLKLGRQNRWEVAEQVNAGESGAKIVGTATLDLDGEPGLELVMVDAGVRKLRIHRLQENRYESWKEVELGSFDFKAARVADLNGDQREDLLLLGADQFAVLYAGGLTPAIEELASYETTLERTFPTDVIVGDLNGDGQIDLAMTDTRSHYVEILEYRPPSQIERALYFTVFEEKGFAREEGSGVEPREGLIADVTGDGRGDLILLVHDRVLVYPQDTGAASK